MQPTQQLLVFDSAGNLILPAAHSPGFVAGSTGWSLSNNGSAEFNNVTIRGGLVVSSTDLFYNGTPALGNLVASIAQSGGTDTFGNTYLAGICVYDPTNHIFTQMTTGYTLYGAMNSSNVPDTTNASKIVSSNTGADFAIQGGSSLNLTGQNTATMTYKSVNVGGNPSVRVHDTKGLNTAHMEVSGAIVKTDLAGNIPFTWQSPAYTTGWAGSTSFNGITGLQTLRFRQRGEDDVRFVGGFTVSGAGAGSVLFTVPSGYYNPNAEQAFTVLEHQATGTFQSGLGYLGTTGNFHLDLAGNFTHNVGDEFWVNANIDLGNIG